MKAALSFFCILLALSANAQFPNYPVYPTPAFLESGTEVQWHHRIRDTSKIIFLDTLYAPSADKIWSKPISHIDDRDNLTIIYNSDQNGFQAIQYEAESGDTVWHVMVNRANRFDGRGHAVVGLDATDEDILLAINRDDPSDPSPTIGDENGVFSTLTLDIESGAFIDSTANDTLFNTSRISRSRLQYNPIDRESGKYGHFVSFGDPIYFDTITSEFIFNEIDSFTTQVLWKSIDPVDHYYDPPVSAQQAVRWRRIKDSLDWDITSSTGPVESHDGRALIAALMTADTANYQCYVWEANYDDGSLTAHDRSASWSYSDNTILESITNHVDGYLLQTKQILNLSNLTQGYLLIDHEYFLIKKVAEITFDGHKMTHAETLPLPGDDGRLLHICRRQGDSDIYYYVEERDGSYHLAGHLVNPNRPVYAFLPRNHTWDNSGNLVGHFQVMLDSITIAGEKFQDGQWLFLYKINKDDLDLEPTALADVQPPSDIRLSPNPGVDIVNVGSDRLYDRAEVYSVDGQLMIVEQTNPSRITCGSLPPGLYIIRLYDGPTVVGQGKWIKVE